MASVVGLPAEFQLPGQRTRDPLASNRRGYWQEEIDKALKRWQVFHQQGNRVIDRYRLERETGSGETDLYRDRYNILYSSTETTKPSLYAQTPKVEAKKRHTDRTNPIVTLATMLMEVTGQYALEEINFDGVMKNLVQDFLLPGMGVAWCRYVPKIKARKRQGANDNDVPDEYVDSEKVEVDYVHFKDFITGVGRVWAELPWIARRVYFNKKKAEARFGKEKAQMLKYSFNPKADGNGNRDLPGTGGAQAIIWEIWDKENRKAIWFSEDFPLDVLEERDDPLRLKDFWPCPEPVRAVTTTTTFVPKSFYSQYKAQAEELDNLTERVRYLTEAIRVIGVYDGSQAVLQQLLTGKGNKMVAVDNWAMFAQNGGIKGVIDYVPIRDVAEVLSQLLAQREVVKGEIYEITGFSDIVRGVSKASETLGAQQIKADWAGGRLRDMQKEIQRLCRDTIRIITEIQSEHFSEATLALYAGFEPPEVTPEEQQAAAQYTAQMVEYQNQVQQFQMQQSVPPQFQMAPAQPPQMPQKPPPTARQQAIEQFKAVVQLLRSEKERCAQIGIETDSTIMPDEAAERKDRMDFLGAAGAFMQQAGPMAMQYPDMRGLLGAMLMFTVRTFRASRPLEKEFEEFTKSFAAAPAQPPPGQGGEGGSDPAAAQAQVQSEQIKAQAEQAKQAAADQSKKYEVDTKAAVEREKAQMEHQYRMAELAIKRQELILKQQELGIKQQQASEEAEMARQQQQHKEGMDRAGAIMEGAQFSANREDSARQFDADERARQEQKKAA